MPTLDTYALLRVDPYHQVIITSISGTAHGTRRMINITTAAHSAQCTRQLVIGLTLSISLSMSINSSSG